MSVFQIARRKGIRIEFDDLGTWGSRAELRSEYDPNGPTIRINTRAILKRRGHDIAAFINFAVAHEIYHHQEHGRKVRKIADHTQRERAADDFASQLVRSVR